MANKTPHIVGGGLGTIRKEAQARVERERKAQAEAERKAKMARFLKSVSG